MLGSQMDMALVSLFYDGYGKYLPELCGSLADQDVPLSEVAFAGVGDAHGLSEQWRRVCEDMLEDAGVEYSFVFEGRDIDTVSAGALRNQLIARTAAEWITAFSVDDVFLPPNGTAILSAFIDTNQDADVIAAAWIESREGESDQVVQCALPQYIAETWRQQTPMT